MKQHLLFFTFIVAVLSIDGKPRLFTLFNTTKYHFEVLIILDEVVYIDPIHMKNLSQENKVILKNTDTGMTRVIQMNPGKTLIINN
ncbi:MAG: hypothetical protein LVQ75_00730 [Candidatus Babeliales bacterium]|jgi:hypothetical protein